MENEIKKEVQTIDNRWYQMVITPYYKEQEQIHDGVIVTFNDITELKKTQNKLSLINADHNTFIYSVSHDLKGPLANIIGLISYLSDAQKSDKIDTYEIMKMIHTSASNLTETINELSDIAKIEAEIEITEPVNINELYREVKFSIQDNINKANATIICDFDERYISFSKKNLRSIMINLVSNAIKYQSPERDPEVIIKTAKENDFIVLSVQDNGLGIEPDKIEEIFNVFKRTHNHVEGSGVGLYLVKKIITNAGGEILVESKLGKGSTFKAYFKS